MHRLEADGAEVGASAILEVCRDHDLDCPDLVLVELVLVGEGRCGQESHQGGQLGQVPRQRLSLLTMVN